MKSFGFYIFFYENADVFEGIRGILESGIIAFVLYDRKLR